MDIITIVGGIIVTLGERIRHIREDNGATQEEFANKIRLARNTITLIESGRRNPSERTLADICSVFHVNYLWLKDEVGEIYNHNSNDSIILLLKSEYDLDDLDIQIIEGYLKLPPIERQVFKNYIKNIGAVANE